MPLSSSAIPTTRPKSAICSAMYETFSAVARAVSVTHVLRAPFETGLPLVVLQCGCLVARAGGIRGIAFAAAKRPICA